MGTPDVDEAVARAERALSDARAVTDLRCPTAATLHRGRDLERLLAFWSERAPGSRLSDARYRWELTHARAGDAAPYLPERPTPWRPRDASRYERDPDDFERRLTLPIAIADGLALLAASDDPRARALLSEAEPVARTDLAGFVRGTHAWTDTFALACLARRPIALERMRPFAIAIVAAYAPSAEEEGFVRGTRFPFHEEPLVSASAALATGAYALGDRVPLVGRLAAWVRGQARDDGGFGDADQPSDVLTTVLAADLLARIEPSFDPAAAARFLVGAQADDGWFRALGPEAPWLTEATIGFLRGIDAPFARRFAWPRVPTADLDRKTALPTFGAFVDLAELLAALPGLAAARVEVGFVDLVGFRAFNNALGQEMGDAVLAAFAEALRRAPDAMAIRDGGDEMLLVGAPTGDGLGPAIEGVRDAWPAMFRERFGAAAPLVTARWLTTTTAGGALREARERLGRAVGELKHLDASGPRGVRRDLG